MRSCWRHEPRERPTFGALVHVLRTLLYTNVPEPYTKMVAPGSEPYYAHTQPGRIYTNLLASGYLD